MTAQPVRPPDENAARPVDEAAVSGAIAPSNFPLLSPAAWKAFIDTGGLSLVGGPVP